MNESLKNLTTAVQIAPNNSTNHLYLAETLIELDRMHEAYLELSQVLLSTDHSISYDGLREDQEKAIRLIGELGVNRGFSIEAADSHVQNE